MSEQNIQMGLEVILWLQSGRGPLMEAFATLFHYLGLFDVYLLIGAAAYWAVDPRLGRRLLLLLTLSTWSNSVFKTMIKSPRPPAASPLVQPLGHDSGYGLPSGHVQNASVMALGAAHFFRKRWLYALAGLFIVLMALTRMIAGAHFPQDTIIAFLIGLELVIILAALEVPAARWLARIGLMGQVAMVIAAAALMYAVHPILIPVDSGESAWGSVTSIAIFLGLGIGFALDSNTLRFTTAGSPFQRGLRLVIGMGGLMALRLGLGFVFENLEPDLLYRVLRYAILGLWIAYLAPLTFAKLRLANSYPHPDSPTLDAQPVAGR